MAEKRIVILGGGCAALAAAFALTDRAADRARYRITVYQPGWRLGGKGASGRNAEFGHRIEEHGLHIWSGFYENAFWMMRKCYRELDRPASAPLAHVFAAFRPRHYTAMAATAADHGFDVWKGSLPFEAGLPGDSIAEDEYRLLEAPLTPWALLSGLIPWALRYLQATTGTSGGDVLERIGAGQWWLAATVRGAEGRIRPAGERLLSFADAAFLAQFAARFGWAYARAERYHRAHPPKGDPNAPAPRRYLAMAKVVKCLQWWAQRKRQSVGPSDDLNRRALFELIDLFSTVLVGMLRDNLIERGFDAISDEDFLDWLSRHGAAKVTVEGPTLTAFYCYIFAYREGDPEQPSVAAGTALRFAFRLILCSRGGVFWEMMTGMGDAVFAPMYQVLKDRGVKFEFFHRGVALQATTPNKVDAVVIERQVRTRDNQAYDPLIDVGGLPCWPSTPKAHLLDVDEAGLRELTERHRQLESDQAPWPGSCSFTLEAGRDFDHVVLATSIGPLQTLAPDLLRLDPALQRCVEQVKTVATLGLQLWMQPSTGELGWRSPPPLLTAYGKPLDTWADMSHVLASENWKTPAPRSVQYFCGALPDRDLVPGKSPRQVAIDQSERWLALNAAELFPRAIAKDSPPGGLPFAPGVLHDPRPHRGPWHDAQWIAANVEPSERYVQSLPGTPRLRLKADGTSFRNLAIAGDWLRTGLDYGCVESAVIGGFQAARMIGGYPEAIHGEQDFQGHQEQKEPS